MSRNAPCPCGSGRKYKLCCLPARELARRVACSEERVGERIHRWADEELGAEIAAARREFTLDASLDFTETELFHSWFHSDRPLADGRTPAQRHADRPDLDREERVAAAHIAAARLGIHRVIDVVPAEWIELEDIVDGARHRVLSRKVSQEVVRWDLVIGRPSGLPSGDERRLLEQFLTERMRHWIDEPLHELAGQTPRRAADSAMRPRVESLVRNLENGAERNRRDGEPAADLSWIRAELGLPRAA